MSFVNAGTATGQMLYFQPVGGVSGDMLLGAMFDLGVSFKAWKEGIAALHLPGVHVRRTKVQRHGITAVQVRITAPDRQIHRPLKSILSVIRRSRLPGQVKSRCMEIFDRLGRVESEIHGVPMDRVHFHEVGAIDSIVDIVGTVFAIHLTGVRKLVTDPLRLGTGTVKTAHGIIPVPAPATAKLIENFPVIMTGIPAELTTPTGAAVLTTLCEPVSFPCPIEIGKVGYGAGSRNLKEIANVLRVFLGQIPQTYLQDNVIQVECNIDNMNPEFYPSLIENVMEAGALDAYLISIMMKKGRPAYLFSVLTEPCFLDAILSIIFKGSTTIGVRIHNMNRFKLPRKIVRKKTPLGIVSYKEIQIGNETRFIPEYETCIRIARRKNMPLPEVYTAIQHLFKSGKME